jgi:hypothetical protein
MAESAIGVLSVATHQAGWFRADYMSMADVFRIRGRSPSYKGKKESSPWSTDVGEMCKKTGIRRLLKTFDDDPGLLRAMELSREDDPEEEEVVTEPAPSRPTPAYRAPERFADEELPLTEEDRSLPDQTPTNAEVNEATEQTGQQTQTATSQRGPDAGINPDDWTVAFLQAVPKTTRQKDRRELQDQLLAMAEKLGEERYERCKQAMRAANWIN